MTPGAPVASRVLVVGQDADVSVVLHLHLERAGFALFCGYAAVAVGAAGFALCRRDA